MEIVGWLDAPMKPFLFQWHTSQKAHPVNNRMKIRCSCKVMLELDRLRMEVTYILQSESVL